MNIFDKKQYSINKYLRNQDNFSCFPLWKNRTFSTFADDVPENFNPHFTEDVEYKINNQGFRGSNFDESIDIICLGCSFTFGVGLPEHRTWPAVLSQITSSAVANISKPGGSPDTVYRFAQYWIPKLKPKYVVYLQPPPFRFEILTSNYYLDPVDPGIHSTSTHSEIWYKWIANDLNSLLNYNKNAQAIRTVCDDNNVKFLYYDSTQDLDNYDVSNIDLVTAARDSIHPGIATNHSFAEKVASEIK